MMFSGGISGPYTFLIRPESDKSYLSTKSIRFTGKFKLEHKSTTGVWGPIADAEKGKVGFVCSPVNSLIDSIEVEMNGQRMSFLSSPNNNYRTYIENIFTFPKNTYKTSLAGSHFFVNEASSATSIPTGGDFDVQKEHDFSVNLHTEFSHLDKCLPPQTELNIRINRTTSDCFALVSPSLNAGDLRIILSDLQLKFRRQQVRPSLVEEHKRMFNQNRLALYPTVTPVIKHRTINAGSSMLDESNLFLGRLPSFVVIGMLDQRSFTGNLRYDPYFFSPTEGEDDGAKIKHVELSVNSVALPITLYKPDFGNNLYRREFATMVSIDLLCMH